MPHQILKSLSFTAQVLWIDRGCREKAEQGSTTIWCKRRIEGSIWKDCERTWHILLCAEDQQDMPKEKWTGVCMWYSWAAGRTLGWCVRNYRVQDPSWIMESDLRVASIAVVLVFFLLWEFPVDFFSMPYHKPCLPLAAHLLLSNERKKKTHPRLVAQALESWFFQKSCYLVCLFWGKDKIGETAFSGK